MYDNEYIINNSPDEDIFYRQCAELEEHIPGLEKLDELQDVDGSRLQKYVYNGKSIRVLNDRYLNDVHIESEIPLDPFLKIKDLKKAV
jgi:hypothetical protein